MHTTASVLTEAAASMRLNMAREQLAVARLAMLQVADGLSAHGLGVFSQTKGWATEVEEWWYVDDLCRRVSAVRAVLSAGTGGDKMSDMVGLKQALEEAQEEKK